MRAAGHGYQLLSPAEEETIHAGVLRIVERVGLAVENAALLERMAAIGGRVDRARQRVTFSAADAEAFIASCERVPGLRPPAGERQGQRLLRALSRPADGRVPADERRADARSFPRGARDGAR